MTSESAVNTHMDVNLDPGAAGGPSAEASSISSAPLATAASAGTPVGASDDGAPCSGFSEAPEGNTTQPQSQRRDPEEMLLGDYWDYFEEIKREFAHKPHVFTEFVGLLNDLRRQFISHCD